MATIFKDNQFPQVMFKSEGPTHIVNSTKEYQEAVRDGWSPQHVPQEYPKYVRTGTAADGKAIKVICNNPQEEAAVLSAAKPAKAHKE